MTYAVPSLGARRNIADQVANTLRDLILTGVMAPGFRLNQSTLAQQLQASTTPVREALLKLAAEGLVLAQPHHAFHVARISRQDVEDTFWMHGLVASELAVRTLRERGATLHAELAEVHQGYLAAVAERDNDRVADLNWQFHKALNSAADSSRLQWTLRTLLRLTPSTYYRDHQHWVEASTRSHAVIVDAVKARNATRLRRAVTNHIDLARADFEAHLESLKYWDRPE